MLVVPFEVPADRKYVQLRQLLESSGNLFGPNDLLIAAQAQANKREVAFYEMGTNQNQCDH